jgi:hypothetical protein
MKVQAKQAEQTTEKKTADERDDETKTHTHSLLLSSLDHSGSFQCIPFFFLLVHIVSIQISHSLITRETPHTRRRHGGTLQGKKTTQTDGLRTKFAFSDTDTTKCGCTVGLWFEKTG